ncbi:MAG: dTDP-4-dehydrorhamnose 3,5-epimerase family protein [Victivallaceae bacterium]|jgi:dTDP-4-dehydrorhamnose 3,5-epimerase
MIRETAITGVKVVDLKTACDARGALCKIFGTQELNDIMGQRTIRQVNHVMTAARGTVRGIHYQLAPYAEMKFISCLRGRVWDLALDLRSGSPTFLKWVGTELVPGMMQILPEGCAHGMQALEDNCELLYLHTADYMVHYERGIRHDDAMPGIRWPLIPSGLSERDRGFNQLTEAFKGIAV